MDLPPGIVTLPAPSAPALSARTGPPRPIGSIPPPHADGVDRLRPHADNSRDRDGVANGPARAIVRGRNWSRGPKDSFEAEKKAKPTVDLHGFPFYRETLPLKEGDDGRLRALLGEARSFRIHRGKKMCGGFHPDYAVEWSVGAEVYNCLICFGCQEAKINGPRGEVYYDLQYKAFKQLEEVLTPYRKNRPPLSLMTMP